MFKRQTNEILFFSTTTDLKMNGVIYRPSICYQVPPFSKKSLDKYAAEGKVTFYTEKVRFVNGAAVVTKTDKQSVGVPSIVRDEMPQKTKKRGK